MGSPAPVTKPTLTVTLPHSKHAVKHTFTLLETEILVKNHYCLLQKLIKLKAICLLSIS